MKKHIVCYSGGHSSAIVGIEVVRKFGKDSVVLLNHDINPMYESPDVKRFKAEVAEYLEMQITYANHALEDGVIPDQFKVCEDAGSFVNPATRQALCTSRLKTWPFQAWLDANCPDKDGCIIYYGFDASEKVRIQRRSGILGQQGYKSDYPLALWGNRTIFDSSEIDIAKPCVYNAFKHANCIGCLKAKKQHWYVVFCTRPDIWERAIAAEEKIGYSILPQIYLEDLEEDYSRMQAAGIPASEHISKGIFWRDAKKVLSGNVDFKVDSEMSALPCECSF